MKKLYAFFIFLFLLPLFLHSQSKNNEVLKAGFAKTDITPDVPVMLYGYASRKTPSEGIHDPLYARITVFENNGKKVVFISSDLGSYGDDIYNSIRKELMDKFGLKESEIFLSTIHSHSSPVLSMDKENYFPANIAYTEKLTGKLIKAVADAIKNLAPVQTGLGTGYSPVGSNRREMRPDGSITLGRNPYGITDKEVLVMKVSSSDGKALGAIYDYATHSTSLGAKNLLISGDVLGLSAQFVEKILGNEIVTPVFAGASGNIDPWYRVLTEFNTEEGWIPEPVLLGTLLGEEVVHVFRNIKETNNGNEIATAFKSVECVRRKTPDSPVKENTIPVNITVARIGDAAFVGFNVEMITEIGMKIKAASPFSHTFIITHCNGYSGYLPPIELYKEGGYEVTSTRFEPGSAEKVIREALKMLNDL
jgi:neutral ceramidase